MPLKCFQGHAYFRGTIYYIFTKAQGHLFQSLEAQGKVAVCRGLGCEDSVTLTAGAGQTGRPGLRAAGELWMPEQSDRGQAAAKGSWVTAPGWGWKGDRRKDF